jgi:hypothetical protein
LSSGSHTSVSLVYDGTNIKLMDGATTVSSAAAGAGDATEVDIATAGTILTITSGLGGLGSYNGPISVQGSAGADTISISDVGPYSGSITITGNGGNDVFKLGNAFGDVTITDSVASNLLDLTGRDLVDNPLTVDASQDFTSRDGSSLTQIGVPAAGSDVSFANSPGSGIATVLSALASVVSGQGEGDRPVPLVQATAASLFDFADKLSAISSNLARALAGDETTLGAIISSLSTISWPSTLPVTVSSRYRGRGTNVNAAAKGALEVLIDLSVSRQTSSRSYDIDLSGEGVSFAGDPQIALTTSYALNVAVGASTDSSTPTVFIDPGSSLTADISADTGSSLHGAGVTFGSVSGTLGDSAEIAFVGGLSLTVVDPNGDGRVTAGELASGAAVAVSQSAGSGLSYALPMSINGDAGLLTILLGTLFGGARPQVSLTLSGSAPDADVLAAPTVSTQSLSALTGGGSGGTTGSISPLESASSGTSSGSDLAASSESGVGLSGNAPAPDATGPTGGTTVTSSTATDGGSGTSAVGATAGSGTSGS